MMKIGKMLLICGIGFLAANGFGADLLSIPYLSTSIVVDGKLDEECYHKHKPLESFVVAGDKARKAPSTKAWLFWNEKELVCSFLCSESTLASAPPKSDEQDVDGQDRGEIFLWNGDPKHPYYCIEAAPMDALHDYKAEFYRKMDNTWSPAGGWQHKALMTSDEYCIELVLPKAAIEAMDLKLKAGERFRIGVFRGDYDRYWGEPTWITWIDREGVPDFHVAESLGTAELVSE